MLPKRCHGAFMKPQNRGISTLEPFGCIIPTRLIWHFFDICKPENP